MSKDPAFLFYPGDWLGGTLGMTFEEKGAYMDLLMMQFNRGHMTSHMIGQVIGQLWDKLKDKFTQDENGLWFNKRLDIEKEKRQTFVNSRKNNIKGENQYTKKSGYKKGHMTSHMENENEDINKDIIVIKDEKEKVAEFVTLTILEHGKLNQEYGEEITRLAIEKLNAYKGSTGKKYKSDYLAIKNWVINQVKKDLNERTGKLSRTEQQARIILGGSTVPIGEAKSISSIFD